MTQYPFLSDEWVEQTNRIRAEYEGLTPALSVSIRMNQIINDVDSGEKSIIWGDLKEPAYEQIYRKQVAPEMPAFVKEKAPSAEWNMEKQQWETIINGIPVKINVPPEAKK